MTLTEWEMKYSRFVRKHKNGQYHIPDFVGNERADLFHLSDYIVSSVTGGTIWFIPRES